MKGNFCYCAGCKKLIMKNVYMRSGCKLTIKCFFCGTIQQFIFGCEEVEVNVEKLGNINHLKKEKDLTDINDSDIVFLGSSN